jgi:protease IV
MKILRVLLILAFVFVIVMAVGAYFAFREPSVAKNSVLRLTLSGDVPEFRVNEGLDAMLGRPQPAMFTYYKKLKQAAKDPNIAGLVLRMKSFSMGPGKIEELRSLIREFKANGKWTACHADTFGEFGPGTGSYYLASACDTVDLNPIGELNLTGLHAEVMFLRGALDKLHVVPDFDHIAEYKTASDTFTEKAMTPANREMMESLVGDIFTHLVDDIAAARHLTPAAVRAAVDRAPLSARDALQAKLVDGLMFEDEFEDAVKARAGGRLNLVDDADYAVDNPGGERIAVVFGMGEIFMGESANSPFGGSATMGSETYVKAFRQVRKDPSIKAVVFRVDSPGGSAIASELIRHEIVKTKKEKPVVVSMSDVAGSGGYWVAMSADRIVAQPSTLTGSIGVLVGKFNTSGFWSDLLGITYGEVSAGKNADYYSSLKNFTPEQKQAMRSFMEDIYDEFVKHVAEGRKMTVEEVRRIAKGRVWTGAQGLELKLVDRLGGLEAAIEEAKKLAKIPADASVELVPYPKKRTFFEALFNRQSDVQMLVEELRTGRILSSGPLLCPYTVTFK